MDLVDAERSEEANFRQSVKRYYKVCMRRRAGELIRTRRKQEKK